MLFRWAMWDEVTDDLYIVLCLCFNRLGLKMSLVSPSQLTPLNAHGTVQIYAMKAEENAVTQVWLSFARGSAVSAGAVSSRASPFPTSTHGPLASRGSVCTVECNRSFMKPAWLAALGLALLLVDCCSVISRYLRANEKLYKFISFFSFLNKIR